MQSTVPPVPDIAAIAALIADRSRANVLTALLGGKALAAGELARCANVTPQTCSGHLAKLTASGLVIATSQGRHRYFSLAGPEIAHLLESLQVASVQSGKPIAMGPRDRELRYARVCYDHLAGTLGVEVLDRFRAMRWVDVDQGSLVLSQAGRNYLLKLGIDLENQTGRAECKECMDWSERRMHLGGLLGARFLAMCLAKGWLRRREGSRSLMVTGVGREQLTQAIGELPDR